MLHSVFAGIGILIAGIFGGHSLTVPATVSPAATYLATQQGSAAPGNSAATSLAKSTTTQINQPVIKRIVERPATIDPHFITNSELEVRLNDLSKTFSTQIAGVAAASRSVVANIASVPQYVAAGGDSANPNALTNRIDKLFNVTISNATVNRLSGLTASDIPNLSASYLSLSGGTVAGALSFAQLTSTTTASASNGKFLTVNQNGQVVLSDATTPATGGRVMYDKSYWSNLNDFTVTGATPTIVNGAIRLNPVTTNSFDGQNIELKNLTSNDEDVDFEVTTKVVTLSGSSHGIGIGRQSVNPWVPVSLSVQLDTSATPNTLKLWTQASGSPGSPVGTKNVQSGSVAVGDIIQLIYSQRGNTISVTVNDINQHTVDTYTKTANLLSDQPSPPNTSNFRVFGFGGTFDIQSIRMISRQTIAPNVLFIGDSKTVGYSALDINLRFASLIQSLGPVDVFAGGADRTVEIVQELNYITQFKPRYAIVNIGRNDLNAGVPSATWQANYQTIVSTLKAAGVTVIHLMPIPETSIADQSTLTNFINSTYPNDGKIDVSGSWNNSVHLSADTVHPSPEGHRLIANAILASGLIPANANSVIVDTAPYPFMPLLQPGGTQWTTNGAGINYGAGNVGIGTTSPYSMLSVAGQVVAQNFVATSINATSTFSGGLSIGSLSGFLKAIGGAVATALINLTTDVTGILSVANGGTGVATIASGYIPFGNGASTIATSSSLFWDNTNGRLGIGTTSPYSMLSVAGQVVAQNFVATSATATSTLAGSLSLTGNLLNLYPSDMSKSPTLAGTVAVTAGPKYLAVSGHYAYITNTSGTLQVVDITQPGNPVVVGSVTLGGSPNVPAIAGRYAYITNDSNGNFNVVDISNPSNPKVIATLNIGNANSVVVSGPYAYVPVYAIGSLFIINISNPSSPVVVGAPNAQTIPFAFDVAVSGQYAYVAAATAPAMTVVNISNPLSPVIVGSVATHASFPVSVNVSGRYAYVLSVSPGYLDILDISNPANPVTAGSLAVTGARWGAIEGHYLYAANNGANSFSVYDVANPSNPVMVASTTQNAPYSVAVSGRYAYVVDNTGNKLAVWDVGGIETIALNAQTIQAGSLQVFNTLWAKDLNISDGIGIGARGIFSSGPVSIASEGNGSVLSVTAASTTQSTGKTAAFSALSISNFATSSTNSIIKSGLNVQSTGAWTGTGSSNIGLYVSGVAGAANNYDAIFNGGGNVGIGTTTPYSRLTIWGPDAASSSLAFNVVNNASTTLFSVFDGGNAQLSGTLTQSSDRRLKTNVQTLNASAALTAINLLTPVTYNWLDPEKGGDRQYGFIAQDVQKIFPQLVSTTSPTALTPDGTLGLNYLGLIAPLVEAVQTLSATVQGFAQSFTTKHLCVQRSDGTPVCINGDQLATILAGSSLPTSGEPTPPVISGGTTPPSINILGNNPAVIHVGDTYIDVGAIVTDNEAHALGYKTFLNGALVSNIVIDTTAEATDTIDYVATDTSGNTATSTRIVTVQAPIIAP